MGAMGKNDAHSDTDPWLARQHSTTTAQRHRRETARKVPKHRRDPDKPRRALHLAVSAAELALLRRARAAPVQACARRRPIACCEPGLCQARGENRARPGGRRDGWNAADAATRATSSGGCSLPSVATASGKRPPWRLGPPSQSGSVSGRSLGPDRPSRRGCGRVSDTNPHRTRRGAGARGLLRLADKHVAGEAGGGTCLCAHESISR
jgi:hypothetical protein